MKQPFFSIVIPTKNRPELLRDAITSVILQDFEDYEFIVSDNFNDEKTKKVVDEFVSDPRLRYFRTEKELNIPDHWEFASLKANGEFVLILTDRSLLRRGALKKINQLIQNSPPEASLYSWQHLIFDKNNGFLRAVSKATNTVEIFLAQKLLEESANFQEYDYRFPVNVNSCYSKDLAREIRKKHGRLFNPICPDAFSGFLLLSYAEKIACLNEPLFVMQTAENSTGMLRDIYGPSLYLRTLNLSLDNWCRYVPIKAPFAHNFVFDDYLTVRAMVKGKADFSGVNWVRYFVKCYEELIYFGKVGFIHQSRDYYLEEWKKALDLFGEDVKAQVKKKIWRARIYFTFKAFLRRVPFLPFLRKIQNKIEFHYSNKNYSNVLEAAGFSDTDLRLQ